MTEAAAFVGVLFVLGLLGSGVVALFVASAARRRAMAAEERADFLRRATERLEGQLLELKREVREVRALREEGRAPAAPADLPPVAYPAAPPAAAPVPPPPVARPEAPAPAPERPSIPAPEPVAAPAVPPPPVFFPASVAASLHAEAAAPESEATAVLPTMAAAAPPVPPPPFTAPPAPPAPRRFDLEGVGMVKLLSWVAGIAFALGAVFFLRYSIDQGWLSPLVRSIIGFAVGATLVAVCEMKVARGYAITANALHGAGLFTLFATAFAAHALWHLVPALAAFAFMALVAAVAVGLSIRRESLFIALLGLLGAFATPALLSTGEDRPFGLFGYLLLLNAGLAWVAQRKRWPVLGLLALVGTTIYQWGWVAKFLAPGKLPLAIGVFLVFPLLSLAFAARRRDDEAAPGTADLFRGTLAASAALPALFALYVAALPAYGARFSLLFGFLAVLAAGLSAVAVAQRLPQLHAVAAGSTLLVFATWLATAYTHAAWPAILFVAAGFVVLHAAVPFAAQRFAPPAPRLLGLPPALVLFVFPALVALEPETASPGLFFGVLLAVMALLAALALWREEGLVHFAASFFVLAAEAAWSVRFLTRERLLAALLVYGAVALFYLGVPLLARRLGRALKPEGSGSAALLLSVGLVFFLAAGPLAPAALWGMALLLALLNVGLLVEARTPFGVKAALLGMLLSWAVLVTWWSCAPLEVLLVPALVVTAGFAVLVLGGTLRAGRDAGATGLGNGAYLALVGHVFLLFVASQAKLALPPWPLLGVLAVLTLALGVAALVTGRGALHVGGVAAGQVVLAVWVGSAKVAPWPGVGLAAAAALGAFGVAWLLLARRRGLGDRAFPDAAVAGLFLAELVALVAVDATGAPPAPLYALFQLALGATLLWLAFTTERLRVALFAVAATTAGLLLWSADRFGKEGWRAELLVAAAILVPFLLFPLLLDARVGQRKTPHLAAVLATVPFFLAANHAMQKGGLAHVVGLLPLALAAALMILLRRLLRLEAVMPRHEGRLALVAGAVLAYVTVTIPLQLEKEWITIGWAVQAAALAWLYRRIPHRGLLLFGGGLWAAVFVRLVFNTAVFEYHPRGGAPILNWYLYTYLVAGLAFFAGAKLLRTTEDQLVARLPRLSSLLPGGGTVLLFLLLNVEVADYYSTGAHLTFNFTSASLAQDLTYTIAWALFAIALLAAGIAGRSRPARIAALALLVVTVVKCFLHDLWRLGGLYRVASFVGLALCLTLVALALQRFVLAPAKEGDATREAA